MKLSANLAVWIIGGLDVDVHSVLAQVGDLLRGDIESLIGDRAARSRNRAEIKQHRRAAVNARSVCRARQAGVIAVDGDLRLRGV